MRNVHSNPSARKALAGDPWSLRLGPILGLHLPMVTEKACLQVSKQEATGILRRAKFEALFDQGTVKLPEDQLVIAPPFFGAFDGTSEVYWPSGPQPQDYDGRSGGAMASYIAAQQIRNASPHDSLEKILSKADSQIKRSHEERELDLTKAGKLGGTVGIIAHIDDSTVRILQWGDCFAAWQLSDGSTAMTKNQTAAHERQMLKVIKWLMENEAALHPKDDEGSRRQHMWKKFGPFLNQKRSERINNRDHPMAYGFLCGQGTLLPMIRETVIPTHSLKSLILSTDGLVPFEETTSPETLSRDLFERFHQGGLTRILEHQRAAEKERSGISHVTHTEAASLAIQFEQA